MIISSASLAVFTAGACASLAWCILVLGFLLRVQIPNMSQYPEIDLASRCVESSEGEMEEDSVAKLLHPLSNATSSEIRMRLFKKRFFVGSENGHVQMGLYRSAEGNIVQVTPGSD